MATLTSQTREERVLEHSGAQDPARETAGLRIASLLDRLNLAIAAAGTVMLVVMAYQLLIATPWVPLWDESFHQTWGMRIWHDIGQGDWYALLRDTHNQRLNPFIGSYLSAGWMLLTGPTFEATRTGTLLAGVLAWVLLCWLATLLAKQHPATAAAAAGLVWGTSPMFLYFSSKTLLDSYALNFVLLAIISVIRFRETNSRIWALAAGLLTACTFLTKFNVGMLLVAALLLGLVVPELWRAIDENPARLGEQITRPWVLFGLAAGLPAGLYLLSPGVYQLWGFAKGSTFFPTTVAERFAHYAQSLFTDYVAWAPLAAGLLAGLLVMCMRGWRDVGVRVAVMYVLLNFLGALAHRNLDPRLLWAAVALLCALAGAALAKAVAAASPRMRAGLGVALLAVTVTTLVQARPALREFVALKQPASRPEAQSALRQVMQFVGEHTRPGHTLLAMGFSERGIGPDHLKQHLFDTATGVARTVELLPYPGLPTSFGYSAEPSPLYAQLLQKALAANPRADLVLFRHDAPHFRGPMFPWAFAWHMHYLEAAEQLQDWHAVAELETGVGLGVRIYRRKE